MKFEKELVAAANDAILKTLAAEKKDGGNIKISTQIELDGKANELALIGYVSHEIEDGSCIALLNPHPSLMDEVKPNCGYSTPILKEIIAKKCDAMVQIWQDAYVKNGLAVMGKYQSRNPRGAAI